MCFVAFISVGLWVEATDQQQTWKGFKSKKKKTKMFLNSIIIAENSQPNYNRWILRPTDCRSEISEVWGSVDGLSRPALGSSRALHPAGKLSTSPPTMLAWMEATERWLPGAPLASFSDMASPIILKLKRVHVKKHKNTSTSCVCVCVCVFSLFFTITYAVILETVCDVMNEWVS